MAKKQDYKKYTITLHPLQSGQLNDVALSTNCTYSEIIRAALSMYLGEHKDEK